MKRTRVNERGSVSIMMALAVAGIGGLVALQMSMAYRKVHARHTEQKAQLNAAQSIQRLARLFKQAHMQYEMNSDCTGAGSNHGQQSEGNRRVVGRGDRAVGFCLPSSQELCLTHTEGERTRRICASANSESLNWRRGASGEDRVVIRQHRTPERRSRQEGVENRMVVPATNDSAVWKNCDTAGVSCVRIALCPEGQRTCSEREAVAFQVIRL